MRGRNQCTSLGDVSSSVDEKHTLGKNWPERSLSWWFSANCSFPCPRLMSTGVTDFGSHDRCVIRVSQASGTQHIPDSLGPRLLGVGFWVLWASPNLWIQLCSKEFRERTAADNVMSCSSLLLPREGTFGTFQVPRIQTHLNVCLTLISTGAWSTLLSLMAQQQRAWV